MSKAEDLDVKGREVQKYSEKLKNVDLSIDWEKVDYFFLMLTLSEKNTKSPHFV